MISFGKSRLYAGFVPTIGRQCDILEEVWRVRDEISAECGHDLKKLAALLRERYETSIVPGKFFGLPAHFRLGLGSPAEIFAEGIARLSAALNELTN